MRFDRILLLGAFGQGSLVRATAVTAKSQLASLLTLLVLLALTLIPEAALAQGLHAARNTASRFSCWR